MKYILNTLIYAYLLIGFMLTLSAQQTQKHNSNPQQPATDTTIEWNETSSSITHKRDTVYSQNGDFFKITMTKQIVYSASFKGKDLELIADIDSITLETPTYRLDSVAIVSQVFEIVPGAKNKLKINSKSLGKDLKVITLNQDWAQPSTNRDIVSQKGTIVNRAIKPQPSSLNWKLYKEELLNTPTVRSVANLPTPPIDANSANEAPAQKGAKFIISVEGSAGACFRKLLVNTPQQTDNRQIWKRNNAETDMGYYSFSLGLGIKATSRHAFLVEGTYIKNAINSTYEIDWSTGYQTELKKKTTYNFSYWGVGAAYQFTNKKFVAKTGLYYLFLQPEHPYTDVINSNAFDFRLGVGVRVKAGPFQLGFIPTLNYFLTPINSEFIRTKFINLGLSIQVAWPY